MDLEIGEFEIDENPDNAKRINVEEIPVCVTFTKIGNGYVVDATLQEELCMNSRLTFAINKKSTISSIQKGGSGTLDPTLLSEMLENCRKISADILQKMDTFLNYEEQQQKQRKRTKAGFFG